MIYDELSRAFVSILMKDIYPDDSISGCITAPTTNCAASRLRKADSGSRQSAYGQLVWIEGLQRVGFILAWEHRCNGASAQYKI